MRIEVSVLALDKELKKFEKKVKITARKILKILKKNNVSVEIYLSGYEKMKFLNKKFRGKDKAASILSFEEPKNFILPPSKTRKIGEIYLNVSSIKYPASAEASAARQVSNLLAHGLLHLLGYTHKGKNDTIVMEKKEKYVHNRLRHRFITN